MSSAPALGDELNDDHDVSLEFIQEARRPILIQRHLPTIREMEAGLSDSIITG